MTHPPAPERLRIAALAAVLSATVLVVLDSAIANVALPTIARALHARPAQAVWVVTAYQLALVMALLPCAALGESQGYRRVFTGGIALFTAASLACALAPSLAWLAVARFAQGLGGAGIMALGAAQIRLIVPHERLGSAIGWTALTVALSGAAGPTLGAAVLSVLPWPFLFGINLPVGAAVLVLARALPAHQGSLRPLDLLSVALNAAAFAALVLGAEMLPSRTLAGLAALATAAAFMAALVRREMPREAPLIPIDLLRGLSFRLSVIASVCCFTGQSAAFVALPFLLQHGLGLSPLATGLVMTPWPLAVAVTAPAAGRLANRMQGAWLCGAGGACLAAGLSAAAFWPLHRGGAGFGAAPLVPLLALCGAGFGLFQVPNNRNMLLAAPRARSGAAGGMQSTARLAGQTLGAVTMSLLFALSPAGAAPRLGLCVAAVMALAAGLVSVVRGGAARA